MEYDDFSLAAAEAYARNMDSDFGGTEILSPLTYIYGTAKPVGSRRFIFVLTDGEVSNTNDVIKLAQDNANNTKVFSVGIGQGASTALVQGIARVSGGMSEMVRDSGDQMNSKVIGLMEAAMLPSMDSINLEWSATGGSVEMKVPKDIPLSAYKGRVMSQYAVFRRSGTLSGRAVLAAIWAQRTVRFDEQFLIPYDKFSARYDPIPLHRLAAKAKLTELVDKYRTSNDQSVRDEAVLLSIATGVVCEFTALVAIDQSGQTVNNPSGGPLFINIGRPSLYTTMSPPFLPFIGGFAGLPGSVGRIPAAPPGGLNRFRPPMVGTTTPPSSVIRFFPTFAMMTTTRAQPTTTTVASSSMDAIVQLQSATGKWRLDDDLIQAIGSRRITTVANARQRVSSAIRNIIGVTQPVNDDTVATAMALATLQSQYASKEDQWKLLAVKAKQYLATQSGFSSDIITANVLARVMLEL